MPCLQIIGGVKIYMYSRDHHPPHFHAMIAEHEELVIIASLRTYSGKIPARHRKKVMAWAEQNKAFLNDTWNLLNPPL